MLHPPTGHPQPLAPRPGGARRGRPPGAARRFGAGGRHAVLLAANAVLLGICASGAAPTLAATPAELLAGYRAAAGSAPQPERGRQFFTTTHGREWQCASCHGALPTGPGRHAATGKPLAALAPAANPARFTDAAKVEKWFRRNCTDVAGRECSAAEKADLLAWLMTLGG